MQKKTNEFWRDIKAKPDRVDAVENKIQELQKRKSNSIMRFLSSDPATVNTSAKQEDKAEEPDEILVPSPFESYSEAAPQRVAPKQTIIKDDISKAMAELERLKKIRDSGLGNQNIRTNIKAEKARLSELNKKLKRLQDGVMYSKNSREKKRQKLEQLQEQLPELELIRPSPGRPSLELKQPDLLRTIVDIVSLQARAHERRNYEVLKTCKTLDDLHEQLLSKGFRLARSTLYTRLLPKWRDSNEGKRHRTTVPVKLVKATATARKKHVDSHFAMAAVNYLKELAVTMGPGPVFYLSQDDKARVPLGLAAATKQAPFLMIMEYRVRLPDHDFVVADRHKLIPSVYAAAKITPTAVSYTGPTYIAIRSAKHDKSNASTHSFDFDTLFNLAEFESVIKTDIGQMKPVVIISVDGGPDECPRFDVKCFIIHLTSFFCI